MDIRAIPVTNDIVSFFHCAKCMKEKPSDMSPRDFASLEIGFTVLGIQVWCKRHEINIIHVDFQGVQHPANMSPK